CGGVGASVKPLMAVKQQISQVTRSTGSSPGASQVGQLEIWDGAARNLIRQFAPPMVDCIAPWPIFTYNCVGGSGNGSDFGCNWSMLYRQTVTAISSTVAVVTKGTGTSFTYTGKDANGLYTAPLRATNKLVQNAGSNTWT